MRCEKVREQIPLFLLRELDAASRAAVEEHLAGCETCSQALAKERQLHSAIEQLRLEPPPGMLESFRQELSWRLREPKTRSVSVWLDELVMDWKRWLARPAAALAMVALGFAVGRYTARTNSVPAPMAGTLASEIRYVEPQPSGKVEIGISEVRPRVYRGSLEDRATRELLLKAAQLAQDPLLRLDSIIILARRPDSPEVRQVLVHAMLTDPNPAVRLKAIEGIRPFADRPEVRSALGEVLINDDNVGVRTRAVELLKEHLDPGMAGLLEQVLRREPNEYIRAQCRLMLEAIEASLDTF